MLRRGNSKSSNRLNTPKSTLSVYGREANIDPQVARYYAQAAATHELSRNSGSSDQRRVSLQDMVPEKQSRDFGRQYSVRFAGTTAVPQHQSLGTRTTLRVRALTNNERVPAAYRPPSRSSSLRKPSIENAKAAGYLTDLAAYDEYYTREDDVASTPSSYKRIRKSKSAKVMSTSLKMSSNLDDVASEGGYNFKIWSRVPRAPNQTDQTIMRAPKSMSFLRGGYDHVTPTTRAENDAVIQVARDDFLNQIHQQRLKEQPSFLFRSSARREEKSFRQSLRSGTNNYGRPIASDNSNLPPREGFFRDKARKVSQTFKNRLKNLFRRTGDDSGTATIPRQQVEACKSHGGGSPPDVANDLHGRFADIPHPDDATVARVASRVPSLHTVPSNQQMLSHAGSLRSLRSDGSGKSRVTSWTNTAENTVTSRYDQIEKERQRLSIIQENGTHISSSLFARSAASNQFSSYPAFHRPRNPPSRVPPVLAPVDSQKVYLALMERLDKNSPKARLEAQRMASLESLGSARGRIPPRTSSVNSRTSSHGRGTPATIRHVITEFTGPITVLDNNDNTINPHAQQTDDIFTSDHLVEASMNSDPTCNSSAEHATMAGQKSRHSESIYLDVGGMSGMTPQKAARNELLMKQSKGLRETRSTFFGNSSVVLQRTSSPYRRALAKADYYPAVATGENPEGLDLQRPFFTPPIMSCSDPKDANVDGEEDPDKAYSESVYSRTISGRSQAAISPPTLEGGENDCALAKSPSVTALSRDAIRTILQNRRKPLSTGSMEWKGWLSAEVAALEERKDVVESVKINYVMPSMPKAFNHIREQAQITDEDSGIAQQRVVMAKQPLGTIQQNPQPKPALKTRPSMSAMKPRLPPTPPPIPLRLPLQPTQSRSSLVSINTVKTEKAINDPSLQNKSQPLVRRRSSATIRSTNTPAKLVKINCHRSNNSNSSLGVGLAVDKQFGSVGSKSPYSGAENYIPANIPRDGESASADVGFLNPEDNDAQPMGSRRMVDLFLSSRRRRMAGSDESNAFL